MSRVRARVINLGAVALITSFVALVSQRWSGFTSPDSEFYASLALFGSDTTDRAIDPAYTWTRLGYIVPVRLLVSGLGIWTGFEAWRVALLLLIIGSTYAVVQFQGRSRWLSALLSLYVGLNTVVLAFVGNTYLTGTVIAATFALVALAVPYLRRPVTADTPGVTSRRWMRALVSGFIAGWLVMLNPYACILGLALWLSIRFAALVYSPRDRWTRLGEDVIAGIVGTVLVGGAFIALGSVVFPGRNWFGTYIYWNSRLDYTAFMGDATTWRQDTALIVVVLALLASLIALAVRPRCRWAWGALALSASNIAITVVMMLALPGPWLEAPTYIAKLWPAALLALVMILASLAPGTRNTRTAASSLSILIAGAAIPLAMWAGHFDQPLEYSTGLIIGVGILALFLVTALTIRREQGALAALLLGLTISGTFIGAQILQNGRGNLGIYGQYPFRSAFVDFNYQDQMTSKFKIQRWLLDRTNRQDSIALWTDPQRLTADVAAMQLWGGYNLVTTSSSLSRDDVMRLEVLRPSAIAMYAPDRSQIDLFFSTLPPWSLPSEPECTSEPYLGVGTGEVIVCLTRLTWIG